MANHYPDTPATLLEKLSKKGLEAPWQRAWQTFTDLYLPAIRISVYRSFARCGWHKPPPQMVDDAISDIVVALVRGQEKFQYDPAEGRFRNYIKQLVHWKVVDQIKALPKGDHQSLEVLHDRADPDVTDAAMALDREEELLKGYEIVHWGAAFCLAIKAITYQFWAWQRFPLFMPKLFRPQTPATSALRPFRTGPIYGGFRRDCTGSIVWAIF